MDLQIRKTQFVQEFLRLNNENILIKLEELLKTEKTKLYKDDPEPISLEELNWMIDRAEDDVKNNRIRSVYDLKKDIKSWT